MFKLKTAPYSQLFSILSHVLAKVSDKFTEKVGVCAFSLYQVLSPPLKGPGDEVTNGEETVENSLDWFGQ